MTCNYSCYLYFKHFTAQLNYIKGQMMYAQKMQVQLALLEFNSGFLVLFYNSHGKIQTIF